MQSDDETDPLEAYCEAYDVTVTDDPKLYIAAQPDASRNTYTAGFYDGDLDDLQTDRDAVTLRGDASAATLDNVAAQVVKRMRLTYEDDTLPAVNFEPGPYLDDGRPLTDDERERFVDALDAALDRFPPL